MAQGRTNRPLSDVTVIDFGQIFQGPYASLLLAKAGAFVIKVEPRRGEPGEGLTDPPALILPLLRDGSLPLPRCGRGV